MDEEYDIEELAPWGVIVITMIGALLRVFLLAAKGLWLDEAFSVWLSSHNILDMLHWVVSVDQHPPLYYLLLHYWIALNGDTPYDVRMLSVLFGVAAIPVIYLIGKRISGPALGLAAAMLLALSPFHIRFAQETRMYTLLTFNAAVAIYALVRLLTDPRSVRPIGSQFREYLHAWRTSGPSEPDVAGAFSYQPETLDQTAWRARIFRRRGAPIQTIETDLAWVAFIVFSAATMLTHNTAVLFPVAVNVFVLGLILFQSTKKSAPPPAVPPPAFQAPAFLAPPLGNWLKAQVGIFLLWSPWIPAFIRQAGRVYQEFWIPSPTWEAVIQTLKSFLNEPTLGQTGQPVIIWIPYVLALCLGLLHFRKNPSRFLFLAALFALPFLGELLVSLRRPIFYDRTLIWITIPLFLLLAAGIAQLKFRFVMIVALGILGTNNLFYAADYYRFMQKEDWSSPAGYVANFAEKDDLVLFNAAWVQIPFDYYFKYYEDLYSLQVEKRGVPVDMFTGGVLEPKMTRSHIPNLISLLNGRKRVWLVYSHNSYTDPMGLIPQTLASEMKLVRQRDFYGVQVQLYEAQAPPP